VGVRSRASRDFGMPKTPKVSARQHMVLASCSLMRTMRTLGCFSLRMFVTRTPSMTGIERSRRTTSGDNSVTFRTASSPSTASPHTNQFGFRSTRADKARRTDDESSAMRTFNLALGLNDPPLRRSSLLMLGSVEPNLPRPLGPGAGVLGA